MRIAMLTNNYKPYVAGVPVSIEHLAQALRKLGHTVYVFAPSYVNQTEDPFVIRYPSFPVQIAGAPVPNVLTGIFLRMVKKLHIDVLHVHHPAIAGNVAFALRRQLGIPVVYTYHTRYEAYLYYVRLLSLIERCTGVIENYLQYYCNHCDMIFAPTPEMKEHLVNDKKITAPIEILPTGLPDSAFCPSQKEVQRIRDLYLKDANYLFVTTARLAKEKNLDFMLEALRRLKEKMKCSNKTFRYLFIGKGLEQEHLKERCRELGLEQEVVFVGAIENDQMKNYLAACDLFLFSSKSETQGIVVLEAMAAGTPVIAVDATGVRDVVRTGNNGILTAEDADCFAQAVMQVLYDSSRYKLFCEGAVKTALAFEEKKIAGLAQRYYSETLNSCQNRNIHAILKWY